MSCLQVDLLNLPERRDSRLLPGPPVMCFVKNLWDFGAEVHLVCPAHKHLLRNVTKLTVLWQLETAGGDLTLDTIEGLAL